MKIKSECSPIKERICAFYILVVYLLLNKKALRDYPNCANSIIVQPLLLKFNSINFDTIV